MDAQAWLIGLHLLSAHSAPGYELVTPGIYLQHASGATAGLLRNSEGRRGVYAGWTWHAGRLSLTVGVISGYQARSWTPMLVPSFRLDHGLRISVIPNPFGASALHLSLERSF